MILRGNLADLTDNYMNRFERNLVMKPKISFVLLLLTLLLCLCGQVFAEAEYFAVFMEGKKVGYAIHKRQVSDGKVISCEEVSITVSRFNVPISIHTTDTSIETAAGEPLGFASIQDLSVMQIKMTGTGTTDGTVEIVSSMPGGEQKQTLEWPSGAVMAEGMHLLAKKKGLKEGTNYTARIFSPSIIQAIDAQIKIGAKEQVDLLGRVVNLTKVTTKLSMPGGVEVTSIGYVDDELREQKIISNVAGMQIEMIACAKDFALSAKEVIDVIDKLFIASPQPLGDVDSARSAEYLLVPSTEGNTLEIPSTDNQTVRYDDKGWVIVTVKAAVPPAGSRIPYKGSDKKILELMQPARFIQSQSETILELAHKAVAGTEDTAEAAQRIESFVADYIVNKDLSVGYASAVEVAQSKQGDCTEFAVLTVALCRAAGIPARVVMGLAYVGNFAGLENCFGGHAWVEVYVKDRWFGLDAAFKSAGLSGYGPGHIALAKGRGNPEDFFALVNTLGQFKIEKAKVQN